MDSRRARGKDRRENRSRPAFPVARQDGTRSHVESRSGLDRRALGFISTFRMFRGVPYVLVEEIVAGCELREFPVATLLLKRGDFNTHVAIVVHGRLRIHLDAPDSEEFIEIAAGECAGEMSIIDREPVSAWVVAEPGCQLLLMDGATFLSRVLVIPEVARNLMAAFAERTRANNTLIIKRMKAAMELQRLQRELRIARHIQAGMMPLPSPLFPERRDIDCVAHIAPAREIGGDFYDAYFVDQNTLFLAIGDACGKGMPAALLMVRTLALLRSEATRRTPGLPADIRGVMGRVNALLSGGNESQMFSTVFAALFDVRSGLLRYVNAGHGPPLLAPDRGPCRLLATPHNVVVGVKDGIEFRAGEEALARGSTLLLYTDGITEAWNVSGEQFGESRLMATIDRAPRDSAATLVDDTLSAVRAFSAGCEQADDLSLLALRYAD